MSNQETHWQLENNNELSEAIKIINEKINGHGFSFREDSARWVSLLQAPVSESGNAIIILTSFDFPYYHGLEIIFYLKCLRRIHLVGSLDKRIN